MRPEYEETKGMKKMTLIMAVGMAAIGAACADDGREQTVLVRDCPASVLRTLRAQAGNGRILEIEKERAKRCGVVYEAEIRKIDGRRIEVTVAPCGKLLKVETED